MLMAFSDSVSTSERSLDMESEDGILLKKISPSAGGTVTLVLCFLPNEGIGFLTLIKVKY